MIIPTMKTMEGTTVLQITAWRSRFAYWNRFLSKARMLVAAFSEYEPVLAAESTNK